MNWSKPKIWTGIMSVLFFGVALYLRVYFPYDKIFTAEGIKFAGNDAYYFMRQVDILVHNFPNPTTMEPYFIYPGGVGGPVTFRFFSWLLAGVIWVIGLGSPTEQTIDIVGAYFPAVLGALTIIPVYFIGKELFGRGAGVLSAGLVILLPGEFLGRSILGFTDHEVAGGLFTTVSMLFLILAVKTASQRQLTVNHLRRRNWATLAKPAIYSLLAGIFLGIYILTWIGALLFVFLITVYFIIQFIIDHLKGKSTDYLSFVGVITFLVALIVSRPIVPGLLAADLLSQISMVIALLIPLVLNGVSRLMTMGKIKLAYYPVALVGLGLVGLVTLYAINPSLVRAILEAFRVFLPKGAQLTTLEMQPILFPSGNFSLGIAWGNFTTSLFLSLIALGVLIYLAVKRGNAEKSLLLVWSLVILAATLGQRRFAYYFAVNVALLTGYLSWQVLNLAVLKKLSTGAAKTARGTSSRAIRAGKGSLSTPATYAVTALAVLVIFSVVFFPNIEPAIDTASSVPFVPSDAWVTSLSWLKENTPDPFGNPGAYYEIQEPPPAGENYTYPESVYGVMAWWDFGYWITRIAHRIPNANPSQSPEALTKVASFFTSQDEGSTSEITQELDSKYIVIDYNTAMGMFYAMVRWAGREQSEFFDVYWVPQENQAVPVQLYYPEYYRSMSTRLYNFNGKAVIPESTIVISYQDNRDQQDRPPKLITAVQQFTSYKEAEAYLVSQGAGNYKIVGNNPFVSPVPLEALEHYRLIYGSANSITMPVVGAVPEVKIFEYLD